MKKHWLLAVAALCFTTCIPKLPAQEKPKAEEAKPVEYRFALASLKVTVVFTEYDGDKKLKSLPYVFLVTTRTRDDHPEAKIRVGNRVPVYTGGGGDRGSVTYLDIGTNIDGSAEGVGPDQYRVHLSLERSWVEGSVSVPVDKIPSTGESRATEFAQPIVRQYRAELTPILKNGQSIETNLATDPLSGRVVKLEVSMTVLK